MSLFCWVHKTDILSSAMHQKMSQNAEKKKSIFKTHQKVGLEKMKKRFGECSRSEGKKVEDRHKNPKSWAITERKTAAQREERDTKKGTESLNFNGCVSKKKGKGKRGKAAKKVGGRKKRTKTKETPINLDRRTHRVGRGTGKSVRVWETMQ